MKDYYVVLGIGRSASQSGVRTAFRRKARERHPDVAGEDATQEFQELTEAYEVLSDPDRRASYDRSLRHSEAEPPPPRQYPRRAGMGRQRWAGGNIVQVEVAIGTGDAVRGGTLHLDVPWLGVVALRIPAMAGDGTVLQADLSWGVFETTILRVVLRVV